MKRAVVTLLAAFAVLAVPGVEAAGSAPPPSAVQPFLTKLKWRSIGPFLGGRVVAVAGVPSKPNTFYFGGVQGGVWRSIDYGTEWENISDGKIPSTAQAIGALAVAPSDPKTIYAGSGERDIRGDFDTGDGIYKTTDAGKSWHYAGLRETHTTSGLAIDPRDPNVVYAASMGHVFAPNPERGVFKSTDGGKTWKKILFFDDATGAIDLQMDPRDPRTLYAAMWQAQRLPWKLISGGPGSGIYKTTDAGAHWSLISRNPGFAQGPLGRMGIGIAASDPRVVYAMVQAHHGGVFRSDDGGGHWKLVNDQWKLRQRAFYYMTIHVDPTNPKIAYAPNVDNVWKTTDGGVTFKPLFDDGKGHGDYHIVWINPNDPKIMLEGDDGGAIVSVDGGSTWSSYLNQPTGQFYHVALDDQFPFHVYGASQDEASYGGPSATAHGYIAWGDWQPVAGGESTFVAPEPGDAHVTYGSAYASAFFRLNAADDDQQNVSPWPPYLAGSSAAEQKYRFGWTHPIMFSPANEDELLTSAQVVFSSVDRGKTWKAISPDLTRNDPRTEGPTGGPIDLDQTGVETFPDISSLAVSPKDGDVMWAGSADGLVHVTRDHGGTWNSVTPPQLGALWSQISSIEPSHADAATAYLTASRYMWDDFRPYVFKTTDYGEHWTTIAAGIPADQYAFVVREDPRMPQLLFAGTRSRVYASFDGGGSWQPLSLNLPGVQMRDIAIDAREGQVVLATHGRAFWILDDLALLEGLANGTPSPDRPAIFAPETGWLTHGYAGVEAAPPDTGANPDYGVTVYFNLPKSYGARTQAKLIFFDAKGNVVRSFALHLKDAREKDVPREIKYEMDENQLRALGRAKATAVKPGMNRFVWDMKLEPPAEVDGYHASPTEDFSPSAGAPTVVPGAYGVALAYDGTTLPTQPFAIRLDPRVHASDDDLAARFALEMKVYRTLDALDSAIDRAMAAAPRLPAPRRAAVRAAIADLVELESHSSEGDLLHETKLRTHIAFFGNELEMSYHKPTDAELATYDELSGEATAGIARLQSLMATAQAPPSR